MARAESRRSVGRERDRCQVREGRDSAPMGDADFERLLRTDRGRRTSLCHGFHLRSPAGGARPLLRHANRCEHLVACLRLFLRWLRLHRGTGASVLVEDGRAFSLGAMGHLFCFAAADGQVLWSRRLHQDYQIRMPNWGIAAAPLIEGDLIIVQIGGTDACILALDKRTGQERWKALPDDASYSAPIVIDQAGQRVLVCWTGNRIVGLNPSTGQLHWEYDFPWEQWPIAIATPIWHGDLLLFSDAHKGTLLLELDRERVQVQKRWHRRQEELPEGEAALHCLISTPYIDGEHIYGADGRGVLRCLRLADGHQVWEDRTAVPEDSFATIHLIRHGDRTWLFNERGELIIAALTPQGYREISRAKLLDPTLEQLRRRGGVTWSHPAFANRHVFARNDKELICADLSAQADADRE